MSIRETRKENLRELVGEDTYARFGLRVGMSASHISQILNGSANMGSRVARKIENRLGLVDGWMDVPAQAQPGVDVDLLADILARVIKSCANSKREWSSQDIARLTANFYEIKKRSGDMPDISSAVELAALIAG